MTMAINVTGGPRQVRSDSSFNFPYDFWQCLWVDAGVQPFENGNLWPSSQIYGGIVVMPAPLWDVTPYAMGTHTFLKFRGFTRDSSGNILGTSVVKSYLTSNDQEVRQITSDAGGYFELPDEYAGSNHYLVAYKTGSPDVAGTTVNTLQPT